MGDNVSLSDIAALLGNRNDGNGLASDDGILLLVIILLFGGFGRGFGNQGGGYGAGSAGGNELYPWLNNADQINDGFRDQMIQTGIQGISQQVQGLATQLCNCCGDMQLSLANGFAAVESNANARQMANMQQMFGISQQVSDGLSENRLGLANLNSTILADGALTRQTIGDKTQLVLDKLCALELAGVQRELAEERRVSDQLRQQLAGANLAASQIMQTGQIVDGIYNRLATCPVGTQPVYGNQPIFTCPQRTCGCSGIAA